MNTQYMQIIHHYGNIVRINNKPSKYQIRYKITEWLFSRSVYCEDTSLSTHARMKVRWMNRNR